MSNFKDIAINVLLIIAFIGLVISIVMLYDWTGSVLAGFLVFPAAAVMIAVICFNILGDKLRDILDPNLRD